MSGKLQQWKQKNPDRGHRKSGSNKYETYKTELIDLMKSGYSTQKIAQYLEEVEKCAFKKGEDGKRKVTSLSLYLSKLAKENNIKRAGRIPGSNS